jgi:glycosidase
MIWEEAQQDQDLFNFYRQLTALRRGKDASLRTGRCKILSANAFTLAYGKAHDQPGITTVLNVSDRVQKVVLPGDWSEVILASDASLSASFRAGEAAIDLPPLSGTYIR